MKRTYSQSKNVDRKKRYKKKKRYQGPNYMPSAFQSNIPKTEIKSLDLAANNYTLTNVPVVTPLNLIRAGSSYFNRIGRKINMKSIALKGFILNINGIANDDIDQIRVSIVYDRQTNGALPIYADIFQDTDQAGTNTTNVTSNINLNNRDRFVILRETRIHCPPTIVTVPATVSSKQEFSDERGMNAGIVNWYVKLNLETQYRADSAPAVIGDVATGGLFLVTTGFFAAGTASYLLTTSIT